MYIPPAFREDRPEVMAAMIAAHPLALLVSHGDGGLLADPVPMLWRDGRLIAHLARANPHADRLRSSGEVMAIFQGAHSYVTPAWYASKAEHGRVVPTWNYLTVQMQGIAQIIDDTDWLAAQVAALTDAQEAGRPQPWAVSDAPDAFISAQLRGIVGLEVEVTSVAGKWKASQNRSDADRAGVIAGLDALANPIAEAIPPARTF